MIGKYLGPLRAALIASGLATFTLSPVLAQTGSSVPGQPFTVAVERAEALSRVETFLVARSGEVVVEKAFRGADPDAPVNIKSASKSIISALVGAAIERGLIEGVGQPIAPILDRWAPTNPDPRLSTVTIENLLTMQAGLERTSGQNYGRWVQSRDWVGFALSRPFVDEPGGRMLYSTGNTHMLSAILTQVSGETTLDIAREWLGEPLGISFGSWDRDPQGIYFGGNNMALSPRDLLRFGEMYRNGGMHEDKRVLPEEWVRASWDPQTRSPFTGDQYGYGWFITEMHGHPVYYAWGFGGQMLYVVPDLALTAVMTSNPNVPSGRDGYARDLHDLMADIVAEAEATPS